MSKIDEILKDLEHYEFPDDIINCSLACEEYKKKKLNQAKLAILEVVRGAIDQCLTYNDSDTHIIADDLKKELGIRDDINSKIGKL